MGLEEVKKKKKSSAPSAPIGILTPPPSPLPPAPGVYLGPTQQSLAQMLTMPQGGGAPIPGNGLQSMGPAQMAPQVAAPQPAPKYQAPNLIPLDQLIQHLQPNPQDLQALQGTRDQLAEQAKAATKRVADIGSEFMPNPAAPAHTQFEDFLQQHTQQEIMKHLTAGNSKMDRFEKGMNMGQRLAAGLVIPLMGVLGKNPGSAAGANAAVQDLNAQIANSKSQQLQEKAFHNNAIAGLSQMYEKLDPQSAANMTALLARQIDVSKYNKSLKQEALGEQGKALTNLASVQKDIAGMNTAAGQHAVNAALSLQGQGIQVAGQKQAQDHFAAGEKDKALNYGLRKQEVQNAADRFEQTKKEFEYKKTNDTTVNGRADAAQKLTAMTQLERSMRLNVQDAIGMKADNTPKYTGYADYLSKNKAIASINERLAEAAGVPKEDLAGMFDAFAKQAATPPANNDVLGMLQNAAGQAGNSMKSILGISPPAAAASAAPAAVAAPHEEATALLEARGYKKDKNGQWVKKK